MSTAERITHEIREIGLVTLYFLGCFLFFLTLKALLLDAYDVETPVLATAVVGALVVAKVVVLLGKTRLGNWFGGGRRVVHVLWRSFVYTILVFVVTLTERWFDFYRESGDAGTALSRVWAEEDFDHFLAMNLAVGLSLVVYNVFSEIGSSMGHANLRNLFFGRRVASAGTARDRTAT